MKYHVNIERLRSLLETRPALIKTVITLNEAVILSLMKRSKDRYNYKIYEFLPEDKKTPALSVIYALGSWRYSHKNNIPKEHFALFTKKQRLQLIEKDADFLKSLPDPTRTEFIAGIKSQRFNEIKFIPEHILDEEILILIAEHDGIVEEIPSKFWADETKGKQLLIELARKQQAIINRSDIPIQVYTTEALSEAFNDTVCLDRTDIPETLWTETLAQKALEAYVDNIHKIPTRLITESMCVEAARHVNLDKLPIKTYPVQVAYVATGSICPDDLPARIKNNPEFQKDVVRKNAEGRIQPASVVLLNGVAPLKGLINLKKLEARITEETWVELIKICPDSIRSIKKLAQTDAMIDALLSVSSPEVLDNLAPVINLIKIKKGHAPLLIGCESSILSSTINKFFKKDDPASKIVTQATSSTVEIEMSPKEFSSLNLA